MFIFCTLDFPRQAAGHIMALYMENTMSATNECLIMALYIENTMTAICFFDLIMALYIENTMSAV